MKRFFYIAVLITLALVGVWGASPPADYQAKLDKAREEWRAAAATLVAEREEDLGRELQLLPLGNTSEGEVDDAREHLAAARHGLAQAGGKQQAVIEQSRLIVAIRERELARVLRVPASSSSEFERLATRRRLTSARLFLALEEGASTDVTRYLREVIEISRAEPAPLEALVSSGAASPGDLDWSRRRLAFARFLLADRDGTTQEAEEQLRIAIELCDRYVRQVEKASLGGAMPVILLDLARVLSLENQFRLALRKGNPAGAREHLGRIPPILEQACQRLRESPTPARKYLANYECRLAEARYRVVLASQHVTRAEVYFWGELDE
jgi:hypothetical protein